MDNQAISAGSITQPKQLTLDHKKMFQSMIDGG